MSALVAALFPASAGEIWTEAARREIVEIDNMHLNDILAIPVPEKIADPVGLEKNGDNLPV